MIYVIASIQVKEGSLARFVEIFKNNMPAVLKKRDVSVMYRPWISQPACHIKKWINTG